MESILHPTLKELVSLGYTDLSLIDEAQLRALLHDIDVAVVVHNADTRIISCNTVAQDLLGLTQEQMLNKESADIDWHFVCEDGSPLPLKELPVNKVLSSKKSLQGYVLGVKNPGEKKTIWLSVNAIPIFDDSDAIIRVIISFTNITERKRAEQQLVASEQLFRTLIENSPDHIARYDLNLRRVYLNPALQRLFEIPIEKAIGKTSKVSSPLDNPDRYMNHIRRVIETGEECTDEISYRTPDKEIRWASTRFAPEFDSRGKVQSVIVISNDITEKIKAEHERAENIKLLESLNRIGRILQREGDIEQIIKQALDEVRSIFVCDRAYLLYPCDPNSSEFEVPFESTVEEFPGAESKGSKLPMDDFVSLFMRRVLEQDRPCKLGADSEYPITEYYQQEFSIRSVLAMALRPRVDSAWLFGIHQCSYERYWADQEIRLFEEIGHYISSGLNNLLIASNLRNSEERLRLVFESSPVCIQEEDYSDVKHYLDSLRSEYQADLGGYLARHPEVVHKCADLVRLVDCNSAALALHEAESKEELIRSLEDTTIDETIVTLHKVLCALMSGENSFHLETELRTLNGRVYPVQAFFSVSPGYEHDLGKVLVSLIDISEQKQADKERKQLLLFFESLDRVNKVLKSEGEIDEVLSRSLDVMLDVFDCDRAYLQYPCDPDAEGEWRVPIQSCRPDYPDPIPPGEALPGHPHIVDGLRAMLQSDEPVKLGNNSDLPIPPEIIEKIGVRSMLAMAIYPNVDRPWQLGIHQCSYEREWTEHEIQLFKEIGRRISDGLNSLLITRDLRESKERYHQFFDNAPLPIREEDFSAVKSYLDGLKPDYGNDLYGYLSDHPEVLKECVNLVCVNDANQTAIEFHEADNKQILLESYQKMFVKESFAAFQHVIVALMQGQTVFHKEGEIQTITGRRQNVSGYFSVNPGFEDTLGEVLVSLVDITERKQYEDDLRLASSVFTNSHEGIMVSDASNRIIDINPAFSRITGYTREEVIGKNPKILSSAKNSGEVYADMWKSIKEVGEWQGEIWNKRKSGEEYVELLSIVAVKNHEGQLQHYVGAFTDITLLKEHEEDLDRIAHYDILTSVPNRRLLDDRLDQAIATAKRRNTNLAVCYLDLDGFKPINDEHGHEAGDSVLVEIATRLQRMLRAADTIARLGGDEFVLLWNDVGNKEDCIKALERVLDTISKPIQLGDDEVSVSASIGVTLYPDDDVDADSLLRHADHAMYSAKQFGKNCYQMFDTKLERQISAKVDFLSKIKRALEEEEFELYYQPKVDYFANTVQGVEALLRWNDPILGLVGPKEFLPLIENENLAYDVGRWVMDKAVQQAYSWNEIGINLPISINVFPRHIKYRTFTQDLGNAINNRWPDMPRGRLQMEIVESSALEDLDLIEGVIEECKEMGVKFSLDDFGTGYSSLVYLRRLTIDELKIDQSFVRDMLIDQNDQAIVISVIGLGEAFGLRVVAEGVETTQHAWHLMDLGCRVVQGYALGRPMPADDLERWYAEFLTTGVKMYR